MNESIQINLFSFFKNLTTSPYNLTAAWSDFIFLLCYFLVLLELFQLNISRLVCMDRSFCSQKIILSQDQPPLVFLGFFHLICPWHWQAYLSIPIQGMSCVGHTKTLIWSWTVPLCTIKKYDKGFKTEKVWKPDSIMVQMYWDPCSSLLQNIWVTLN